MPYNIKPPLPVSTIEWIASESMAELPVKNAAMNFVTAIATFPSIAAKIAVLDSAAILALRLFAYCVSHSSLRQYLVYKRHHD